MIELNDHSSDFDYVQDETIQHTCWDCYGIHIRFDEHGKHVITALPDGGGA